MDTKNHFIPAAISIATSLTLLFTGCSSHNETDTSPIAKSDRDHYIDFVNNAGLGQLPFCEGFDPDRDLFTNKSAFIRMDTPDPHLLVITDYASHVQCWEAPVTVSTNQDTQERTATFSNRLTLLSDDKALERLQSIHDKLKSLPEEINNKGMAQVETADRSIIELEFSA